MGVAFTMFLSQSSGTAVSVTNLSFTTATPCFASGGSETASFIRSGKLLMEMSRARSN
jgi:hypothetical protein